MLYLNIPCFYLILLYTKIKTVDDRLHYIDFNLFNKTLKLSGQGQLKQLNKLKACMFGTSGTVILCKCVFCSQYNHPNRNKTLCQVTAL